MRHYEFFTPRYVVEFLLDNSLGRFWVEKTGGKTSLLEKCKYLLTQGQVDFKEVKTIRDPRTIRVLDPACGSMHFGLYAFDLLEVIYLEAWDWEEKQIDKSMDTNEINGLLRLHEEYIDKEEFLRKIPALIIKHNIFGVDIDVRATQIASLALWLRAQRSLNELGVRPGVSRQISHGNVVAAVAPPPAEVVVNKIKTDINFDIDTYSALAKNLFLVPETGILLRLEKSLTSIDKIISADNFKQLKLISDVDAGSATELHLQKLSNFFNSFVKEAGHAFQEKLYVGNIKSCLRLLKLTAQRYDVIVMNPPFGRPCEGSLSYLGKIYPSTKSEIIGMFILRMLELLNDDGYLGAISSRTLFKQGSAEKWRRELILSNLSIPVFVDLGIGVMDNALVEAATYIFKKKDYACHKTPFLIVNSDKNKFDLLNKTIYDYKNNIKNENIIEQDIKSFLNIPGCIFAYEIDDKYVESYFNKDVEKFIVAHGIATGDNTRYVQLYWENEQSPSRKWLTFAKGGLSTPFYYDTKTVVNWNKDASDIKVTSGSVITNQQYYFLPALTWSGRAKSLSLKIFPSGGIFDRAGSCVFIETNSHQDLFALAAVLNSRAYQNVMSVQLQRIEGDSRYECGMLRKAPVPVISSEIKEHLATLAKSNFVARRQFDTFNEESHAFILPELIQEANGLIDRASLKKTIEHTQEQMDFVADKLYGFTSDIVRKQEESRAINDATEGEKLNRLLSWAVGVAFGRFDVRLATGERDIPTLTEPFEPYSRFSPGRLPKGDFPFIPNAGIFVMDAGHPLDLTTAIRKVLSECMLGSDIDVKRWLEQDFFSFHLSTYTSSKRTAPIYWPIGTASGKYVLWIYYQALDERTFYTAVTDFVAPKIKAQQQRFDDGMRKLDSLSLSERRQLESLKEEIAELETFKDSLEELARSYKVYWDDGIALNAIPLKGLIQSKKWVDKLEETEEALHNGELDWSERAAELYPERVRAKCKEDLSLALAHQNRWPELVKADNE